MYRKYRAQRWPDKKWIYGCYVHEQGNDYICYMSPDMFCEVYELIDIKTLGQDTGLPDMKGNEIYEGDLLGYTVRTNAKNPQKVIFYEGSFCLDLGYGCADLYRHNKEMIVVGNAADNPELVGEGEE